MYMLPSTILVAAVFFWRLSPRYALIGCALWLPVLVFADRKNARTQRALTATVKASEPSV
jgi:hypothetical protein